MANWDKALNEIERLGAKADQLQRRMDAVFNESDHPRSLDGKFGNGGGSSQVGGSKGQVGKNFMEKAHKGYWEAKDKKAKSKNELMSSNKAHRESAEKTLDKYKPFNSTQEYRNLNRMLVAMSDPEKPQPKESEVRAAEVAVKTASKAVAKQHYDYAIKNTNNMEQLRKSKHFKMLESVMNS